MQMQGIGSGSKVQDVEQARETRTAIFVFTLLHPSLTLPLPLALSPVSSAPSYDAPPIPSSHARACM